MGDKVEKKLFWRVLLAGIVLVLTTTATVFAYFPSIKNPVMSLICDSRVGFCEDTTTETSVKKDAEGKILERIEITKPQPGKTLWDLLGLAGTLAIPVLVAILGYQFQRREQKRADAQAKVEKERADAQAEVEKERADAQAKVERDIASENLRDEALQAYIDRMSELLLDRDLIRSNDDDPVRDVARTRTLTILRRLQGDGERKARVLLFLYDAGLLEIRESAPLIYLRDADFGEANLGGASLEGAYLEAANLMRANLRGAYLGGTNLGGTNLMRAYLMRAYLEGANLGGANLEGANLEGAYLERADLMGANLEKANLIGAYLGGANLRGAYLEGANLEGAYLERANLMGANLEKANLIGAYLGGANLEGANLEKANLIGAYLGGANLEGANLEGANLERAKSYTPDQIKAAKNWDKAHYSLKFRQQLGLPPESEPFKSGIS